MADFRTITAANSVLMLAVSGLFPVPVQIQGFQTDTAFTTESVTNVETYMGVDGKMAVGWVPVLKKMTVMLQGDSLSNDFFETWYQAEEAIQEVFIANGTLLVPALKRKYTMLKGVMEGFVPIPEHAKTIRGRTFGLTWEKILGAPA